jgi:hypothetical protein
MNFWKGGAVGSVSRTPLYEVSARVFQIAQSFWSTLWSNLPYRVHTVYFADRETWRKSVAWTNLTFRGPCIVKYSYDKTNEMHYGYADCLLAGSGCNILIPLASSQHKLYDVYLLLCIQY